MDRDTGIANWIGAYLDWTDGVNRAIEEERPVPQPALATSEEIVAAYLEWLDTAPGGFSREAMLLTALRAESDCVHILRQLLERALSAEPRTLWQTDLDQEWHALELVAADVHAITGKVHAMQAH